jgi:EPS-associated MarR family transcriptional regulator
MYNAHLEIELVTISPKNMPAQHSHLPLLKLLHSQPQLNQRQLAERMGVSLGKVNYCMRALMAKGLVKLENFSHAENKRQYAYLLTPAGIEEKTRITFDFLKQKQAEYDAIKREIDALQQELGVCD